MNLTKETEEVLEEYKRSWDDIVWIGSRYGYIDVEDFKRAADRTYDSGFGAQEVADDLIIVGKDFIMKRTEYDGSEGWNMELDDQHIKPKHRIQNPKLFVFENDMVGWASLERINSISDSDD